MNFGQNREQALIAWINQHTEFNCETLEMVSGDASFRRYFRFKHNNQSVIAVDAPPEFEDCAKFIDMAKRYRQAGVNVPDVYAYDIKQGFYCQQDFGSVLLADKLNLNTCDDLYAQALACIPAIQTCKSIGQLSLPLYDEDFVQRELGIFTEWLLAEYLQLNLSSEHEQLLKQTFEIITEVFLSQPMAGVHRDFHSRNLMLLNDGEIGVIDFQDAVVGPITYDGVSLLRDCYQTWPEEKVLQWLQTWHQNQYAEHDWQDFKFWFDMTGLQRHIKASGIFARLHLRDNKPVYLHDIPRTLDYIVQVGTHYPQLQDFALFVNECVLPLVKKKQGWGDDH